MAYDKPHLTYDKQLNLMQSRGLALGDRQQASRALRAIGYYRLSAYTYVFRKWHPADSLDAGQRMDEFAEGSSLSAAVALHDFDKALRRLLLEALQQIEIGLRVRIGYQLGKTHAFGQTTRSALDARACARLRPAGPGGKKVPAFDKWLDTYRRNIDDAKHETFVKHFQTKYDGEMPVWVATELMTFGSLLWLYELLQAKDATRIAESLGIKERRLLHGYLRSLNTLRNHCAHNARIWNRSTIYPPALPPSGHTPETLHHLTSCDADRVYFLAALCAHFVVQIDPDSNWPATFRELIESFPKDLLKDLPDSHALSPTKTMGFPDGWERLPLWQPTDES